MLSLRQILIPSLLLLTGLVLGCTSKSPPAKDSGASTALEKKIKKAQEGPKLQP